METDPRYPEKTIPAIRAALVTPEDIEAFESWVAAGKTENDERWLQIWWVMACESIRDPDGRRAMWQRVAEIQDLIAQGKPLPYSGKTARELLAERGDSPKGGGGQ
jgi:hypothetical protein